MKVDIDISAQDGGWKVGLSVELDRQETNALFLEGDKLVSWPTEGMLPSGDAPIDRSSMFLSEITSRPSGLQLVYESEGLAQRTAKILAYQVNTALGD